MQGDAMSDDITHNLTVVREALEAEGLSVHVGLIDAAIEEISGLREANHHYRDSAAHDEKEIAILRDQLASARKAAIEECAKCVPTSWLDPMLSGPEKVGDMLARETEALLRGIQDRIRKLSLSDDIGKS